jgi:hypothetical protein
VVKYCDACKLASMGSSATKGSQERMQQLLHCITDHYGRIRETNKAFVGPKAP